MDHDGLSTGGFEVLDDLCLLHVAVHTETLKDALSLGSTCQRLRAVVNGADAVWQRHILTDFGLLVQGASLKRQYDMLRYVARGEPPPPLPPPGGASSAAGGSGAAAAQGAGASVRHAGLATAVHASAPPSGGVRPFLPFAGAATDGGCDQPYADFWVGHLFTPSSRTFYSSEARTRNVHCLAVLQPPSSTQSHVPHRAFLLDRLQLPAAYLSRDVMRSIMTDQAWESGSGSGSASASSPHNPPAWHHHPYHHQQPPVVPDPLPPLPPHSVEEARRVLSQCSTEVLEDLYVHCHTQMTRGRAWGLLLVRGLNHHNHHNNGQQQQQPGDDGGGGGRGAGRAPVVDPDEALHDIHQKAWQIWHNQRSVPYTIHQAAPRLHPRLLYGEPPLRPLLSARRGEGCFNEVVGLFDSVLLSRQVNVTCPVRCGALYGIVAAANGREVRGGGSGTASGSGPEAGSGSTPTESQAADLAVELTHGLSELPCVKALNDACDIRAVLRACRTGALPPITGHYTNGWLQWVEFERPGPTSSAAAAAVRTTATDSCKERVNAPSHPTLPSAAPQQHPQQQHVPQRPEHLLPSLVLPCQGLTGQVMPVLWFRFATREERRRLRHRTPAPANTAIAATDANANAPGAAGAAANAAAAPAVPAGAAMPLGAAVAAAAAAAAEAKVELAEANEQLAAAQALLAELEKVGQAINRQQQQQQAPPAAAHQTRRQRQDPRLREDEESESSASVEDEESELEYDGAGPSTSAGPGVTAEPLAGKGRRRRKARTQPPAAGTVHSLAAAMAAALQAVEMAARGGDGGGGSVDLGGGSDSTGGGGDDGGRALPVVETLGDRLQISVGGKRIFETQLSQAAAAADANAAADDAGASDSAVAANGASGSDSKGTSVDEGAGERARRSGCTAGDAGRTQGDAVPGLSPRLDGRLQDGRTQGDAVPGLSTRLDGRLQDGTQSQNSEGGTKGDQRKLDMGEGCEGVDNAEGKPVHGGHGDSADEKEEEDDDEGRTESYDSLLSDDRAGEPAQEHRSGVPAAIHTDDGDGDGGDERAADIDIDGVEAEGAPMMGHDNYNNGNHDHHHHHHHHHLDDEYDADGDEHEDEDADEDGDDEDDGEDPENADFDEEVEELLALGLGPMAGLPDFEGPLDAWPPGMMGAPGATAASSMAAAAAAAAAVLNDELAAAHSELAAEEEGVLGGDGGKMGRVGGGRGGGGGAEGPRVQAVVSPTMPIFPISPNLTALAPGVGHVYGWAAAPVSDDNMVQIRLKQPWCANMLLAKLISCEDQNPEFNRMHGGCNIDAGIITVQGPAAPGGAGGGPFVRLLEGVSLL